jgi:hypothetical protein
MINYCTIEEIESYFTKTCIELLQKCKDPGYIVLGKNIYNMFCTKKERLVDHLDINGMTLEVVLLFGDDVVDYFEVCLRYPSSNFIERN